MDIDYCKFQSYVYIQVQYWDTGYWESSLKESKV